MRELRFDAHLPIMPVAMTRSGQQTKESEHRTGCESWGKFGGAAKAASEGGREAAYRHLAAAFSTPLALSAKGKKPWGC